MSRIAVAFLLIPLVLSVTADAAFIQNMEQTPVEVSALVLDPDGEWLEDRDWGHGVISAWMDETWNGGLGAYVWFTIEIEMGENRDPAFIEMHKEVENNTTFFWTGFIIDLTPLGGSLISNVEADASAQFPDVQVDSVAPDAWKITWDDPDGIAGVPIGGFAVLDFAFEIEGNIAFDLIQTPIPEPASVGLLALGGLIALRRRR